MISSETSCALRFAIPYHYIPPAGAGAVEQPLGATGDRADSHELVEATLATGRALLGPDSLRFQYPDELRIEARVDGFGGRALGQSLDAGATAEGADRVVVADALGQDIERMSRNSGRAERLMRRNYVKCLPIRRVPGGSRRRLVRELTAVDLTSHGHFGHPPGAGTLMRLPGEQPG